MNSVSKTKKLAETCVDTLARAYQDMAWEDKHIYGNWLAQTYHYVRHATRLLAFAAARCSLEQEALHVSFLKGIREEGGHEQLAANDATALGLKLSNFHELPETAAYHQTLYYSIDHDGPAALLGYFLPLEGLAARYLRHELARIVALHPPKATTFLKVHCQLDVGHFDDGLKSLEGLSEGELDAVARSLTLSTGLYERLVEAVKGRTVKSPSRHAA